jgi:DNA-binding CsgD family transcriptional regulator
MVMHAENLVSIATVANRLGNAADTDGIPRTAHFVVDGHSLIAIAHTDTESDGYSATSAERRMVVGRIVCAGRRYVIYDADGTPDVAPEMEPAAADILTRRELQIASLIGAGKSDKEIALQLGISGYTVREHIRRIFAKLNIGRRTAIVSYVLRQRGTSLF